MKNKIGHVILIIIGILVSIGLLFDPPEWFNAIIDAITKIFIVICLVVYFIIYVVHLKKTRNENNY